MFHGKKIHSRFLVFVEQDPLEDSFYIDGKNWTRHLNSPGKRGIPNARFEMQDRTPEVWSIEEIQKDFPFAGLDDFKDMNQAKLATWLMKNKDKKEAILFKQYLVQQADISSSYSFNVTQLLQL